MFTFKNNLDDYNLINFFSSLEEKAVFINENYLRGAIIYSIDTGDFRGTCGEKNPLPNTVHEIL